MLMKTSYSYTGIIIYASHGTKRIRARGSLSAPRKKDSEVEKKSRLQLTEEACIQMSLEALAAGR